MMDLLLLIVTPFQFWTGITLFFLIIFQILTARKILKIPFVWHRRVGYIMLILAFMHGVIGIILYSGLFP